MIRFKDKIIAIIYQLLTPRACTSLNSCSKCKKQQKNYWSTFSFKSDYLIGYDHILAEWILFQESNVYAKVWIMNEYLTDIHPLTEKIWNTIYPLCSRCIAQYFVSRKKDDIK